MNEKTTYQRLREELAQWKQRHVEAKVTVVEGLPPEIVLKEVTADGLRWSPRVAPAFGEYQCRQISTDQQGEYHISRCRVVITRLPVLIVTEYCTPLASGVFLHIYSSTDVHLLFRIVTALREAGIDTEIDAPNKMRHALGRLLRQKASSREG